MTYNDLRNALKSLREAGKTDIKLSGKGITKDVLQREYDRLMSMSETETIETETETVTKTIYTFSDMVTSRVPRKAGKGFCIEKVATVTVTESVTDSEIKAMREEWYAWKNIDLMDELIRKLEDCLAVAMAS